MQKIEALVVQRAESVVYNPMEDLYNRYLLCDCHVRYRVRLYNKGCTQKFKY